MANKSLPSSFLIRATGHGLFVMRGSFPPCKYTGIDVYEIAGRQCTVMIHRHSAPVTGKIMKQARKIIANMIYQNKRDEYQILDKEFER